MNLLSDDLLAWYDRNARNMPWRGIHDPYRTWVSEAMLQQTRVETVLPYYDRFLSRFPTLASLAEAPEEDVLKQWEGLGYYSRARNLWLGAKQVMAEFGGVIPSDPAVLRTVRGIGPYTAGAVASIAFDIPVPAVDGNVIRVYSRLFGIRTDPTEPANRRALEELAAAQVPVRRAGDYNQAVMDLGATVCTPGTPDCSRCPLSARCDALARGDAADLPNLPLAKPPKEILYGLLILFSGRRVLMRKRTEKLLQGLWCFPMAEGAVTTEEASSFAENRLHLKPSSLRSAGHARHVFTHRVWEMELFTASVSPEASAPPGYVFVPPDEFSSLALPTAVRAAADIVSRSI